MTSPCSPRKYYVYRWPRKYLFLPLPFSRVKTNYGKLGVEALSRHELYQRYFSSAGKAIRRTFACSCWLKTLQTCWYGNLGNFLNICGIDNFPTNKPHPQHLQVFIRWIDFLRGFMVKFKAVQIETLNRISLIFNSKKILGGITFFSRNKCLLFQILSQGRVRWVNLESYLTWIFVIF